MPEIKRGGRVGPYKVIKPLEKEARGAMATLFLAQLVRLEGTQLAVLKVVSAEEEGAQERFNALRKEVEILQKLRHPNIVKIYPIPSLNRRRREGYISRATNVRGNPWFCALEYLKGGDLRKRLQELESIPLKEAVEIAYQIGSALDYMHSKGYVHWDVKPENMSFRYELSGNGKIEAVLTDFGIARGTHEPFEVTGTVDYMSPERLKVHMGEIPPDQITDQRPADVYALGVVLYEILAGSLPFVAKEEEALKYAILEEQPTPLDIHPPIPAVVEEVIFQALEKDPANRPTMEEFVTMLDRAAPLSRIGVGRPPEKEEREERKEEEEKPKEVEVGPKPSPIVHFLQLSFAIALAVALAMSVFVGSVWALQNVVHLIPTPTPSIVTTPIPSPTLTPTKIPPKDRWEANGTFDKAYGTLTSGQTYKGYISSSDDKDYFWIEIQNVEEPITITLEGIGENSDYDLFLYDENEKEVARSALERGQDEKITYHPAATGGYYILVRSHGDLFDPFDDYELKVSYGTETPTPTPTATATATPTPTFTPAPTATPMPIPTTSTPQIIKITGLDPDNGRGGLSVEVTIMGKNLGQCTRGELIGPGGVVTGKIQVINDSQIRCRLDLRTVPWTQEWRLRVEGPGGSAESIFYVVKKEKPKEKPKK